MYWSLFVKNIKGVGPPAQGPAREIQGYMRMSTHSNQTIFFAGFPLRYCARASPLGTTIPLLHPLQQLHPSWAMLASIKHSSLLSFIDLGSKHFLCFYSGACTIVLSTQSIKASLISALHHTVCAQFGNVDHIGGTCLPIPTVNLTHSFISAALLQKLVIGLLII